MPARKVAAAGARATRQALLQAARLPGARGIDRSSLGASWCMCCTSQEPGCQGLLRAAHPRARRPAGASIPGTRGMSSSKCKSLAPRLLLTMHKPGWQLLPGAAESRAPSTHLPGGHSALRPSSAQSPAVTRVMIAGSIRGYTLLPVDGTRRAKPPSPPSVFSPLAPANRLVACHCARPTAVAAAAASPGASEGPAVRATAHLVAACRD